MGGSVLRPGGGLQAPETPGLAASLAIDNRRPVTAEPLLPLEPTPAAEGDTSGGVRQPHLRGLRTRETSERQVSLAAEGAQAAAPSQPATALATTDPAPLRTTEASANRRTHGVASATSRATLQRPSPPVLDTTHPAKMLRAQRHAATQPLTQRGFVAAPRIPTRADPATHDTSDALDPAQSTRLAPSFQDDLPPSAAARTPGATETRLRAPASDAPATTRPPLPRLPSTEVPEPPAVFPRPSEPPPREATRPTPPLPTMPALMARSGSTPSVQGRTVEIHTGLAQTSVLINGAYIGPAPVVLHLPLGVYTMAIDRPGSTQIQWKMQVDPAGVALLMAKSGGRAWPPGYMPRVFAR
jgi:hypothetical protein